MNKQISDQNHENLKTMKSCQNYGKISTSRNFLHKKPCLFDAFAHQLEHRWHGTKIVAKAWVSTFSSLDNEHL